MQDIINSFKAHLYERTSSPLIGAFIFYWLICNYKIIVILFDEKLDSENKFLKIDKIYEKDLFSIFNIIDIPLNGLLIPIIITLLYILIFPYISNFIHKIWISHQNTLKKISNGKVLTKKEFGELQQKFTELELSFDDKFEKKDTEILKLKSLLEKKDKLLFEYQSKIDSFEKTVYTKDKEINGLRNDISNYHNDLNKNKEEIINLKKEINSLKPNINELEEKLIKLYRINYKNIFSEEQIIKELDIKEIEANYTIDNLLSKQLIELDNIPNIYPVKTGYKLSKKGERFLVEKKYI